MVSDDLESDVTVFTNVAMLPHLEPLKRTDRNSDAICVLHRASASVFCMQCNSYMSMQSFEWPANVEHSILSIHNAQQRMQEREQQLRDLLSATLSQVEQQIEHVRSQQAGRYEFLCAAIERATRACGARGASHCHTILLDTHDGAATASGRLRMRRKE